MSIRLVEEVLDHSPDHLTHAEVRMLVALAEWADTESRECWPGAERLKRRMGAREWDAVAKVLRGLARKGLEVRLPIRLPDGSHLVDASGRPVYAANGHRSRYRVPRLAESVHA